MKQGDLFAGLEDGSRAEPVRPAIKKEEPPPGDARDRRLAVTCFDRPIQLEAGAGTGKTATLVARVVQWCLGPGWELDARHEDDAERNAVRVLRGVSAITFTEAAAAEMSTRVGQALAKVQRVAASGKLPANELPPGLVLDELPDDPAAIHARARALRAALDQLNVSTIHAFCRRLLAAHPLAVGMDPAFEVDATFSQTEMVVREVLEAELREAWSATADERFVELARAGVDPPKIEQAIVELVDAGARASDFAEPALSPQVCERLRTELVDALAEVTATAHRLAGATQNTDLAIDALDATAKVCSELPADAGEALGVLCSAMQETWKGDPRGWRRLRDWRKADFKVKEARVLRDEKDAFAECALRLVRAIEPFLDLNPELLERSRAMVHTILAKVEDELRRRGIATFGELLAGARRLLDENPAIAARERKRMRQLLVDEFQDTDAVQCAIVGALGLDGAERPALFLVGDPKQSIFAWRNADLEAYDAFKERVRAAGGSVLTLSRNFRSRSAVLDEVERTVRPVMEEEHGVQPPFAPLEPGRADAARAGRVEYWVSWVADEDGRIEPKVSRKKGPSYELEACAVARDVLLRRREDGTPWKDFALVFRALTQIEPYLEELKNLGIPYEVQSDRKYYQRREVIDATALVRTVIDPNDHLALVTLIRSPMVGTPDAALLPLWERRFPGEMTWLSKPDDERLAKLESLVREAAGCVPASIPGIGAIEGWEESLVAAVRAIAELRRSFRMDPADVWIEKLRASFLPDATEAARFLGAYRLANLERFFRELLRAIEERGGDVHSIVRTLRANLARDDRSEASRPADSGQDAVQVLTVHGSKGLEFAHVYLAQTHKDEGRGADAQAEFDRRGDATGYRLFGTSSPAWFETQARREVSEKAERVRLLYVALTRAKERLVVLGGWPSDPKAKTWRDAANMSELFHPRADAAAALEEMRKRAVAGDAEPWTDPSGAVWRLAATVAGVEVAADPSATPVVHLPSTKEIATDSRRLAGERERARGRMARPFSTCASREAHAEASEERAGRRFTERDAPENSPPIARDDAQLAGTAVHRLLETLDLAGDPGEELARRLGELDDLPADAAARARELCERVSANGVLDRLAALAEHVVARELAVLVPPDPSVDSSPVGFVSGAIDLLYRDPKTDSLVVADYKTDRVDSEAEKAERVDAYRAQGAVYVDAVQRALGLSYRPRFELWFLHTGDVVAV